MIWIIFGTIFIIIGTIAIDDGGIGLIIIGLLAILLRNSR